MLGIYLKNLGNERLVGVNCDCTVVLQGNFGI